MAEATVQDAPTTHSTQTQIGSLRGCVLSIPAGATAKDVFDQASCHLAGAQDLLYDIAERSEDDALWGVYHLLEIGKALLDAGNHPVQGGAA